MRLLRSHWSQRWYHRQSCCQEVSLPNLLVMAAPIFSTEFYVLPAAAWGRPLPNQSLLAPPYCTGTISQGWSAWGFAKAFADAVFAKLSPSPARWWTLESTQNFCLQGCCKVGSNKVKLLLVSKSICNIYPSLPNSLRTENAPVQSLMRRSMTA